MSRIALLLPDLEVGGAQRVMLLLAKEFVARGFPVDVVVLCASGPLRDSIPVGVKLVDLGVKSYGFGFLGFAGSSVVRLAAWIKKTDPVVLLSSISGANLVALLVRKFYRVSTRIVLREAASVLTTSKGSKFRVMRWLYPTSDYVISLSSLMTKELIEIVGVPKEKIKCIPNPIDARFILEQAKTPLEHPWVKEGGRYKLIVSVGRLIPEKDYTTLIKAFALLPRKHNVRLVIVGEGVERNMLECLIGELDLSSRVQLVGFDVNPWRWMACADLFVLSSCSEGHPNSLLEALVVGLPVIVTEYNSSVRDVAGHCDIDVVNVGDEVTLARKIEKRIMSKGAARECELSDNLDETIRAYLCALEMRD